MKGLKTVKKEKITDFTITNVSNRSKDINLKERFRFLKLK